MHSTISLLECSDVGISMETSLIHLFFKFILSWIRSFNQVKATISEALDFWQIEIDKIVI